MYRPPIQRPEQQRNPTSDSSTLSKLKHWFNKGSELQGDQKASHQANIDRPRDMASPRYAVDPKIPHANGAARKPDPVPLRGPRQLLPRAVYGEVENDPREVDNASIFSSLKSTPPSSLTSAQSHNSFEQLQRPKPSKAKPGGLQISPPQPRQSLLDIASAYADVQNPERAYDAKKKPTPVPSTKSPLYRNNEQRSKRYRPDQPVREVKEGRGLVVEPPSHQRSQKTVVRKMEPQRAPKADNVRQAYRETRFEDFMGKDSPPIPPLPANAASLVLGTSADYRLSRPFVEASEYEEPVDDARPGTASTAALSRSDSRAQTWLRYDRKHGELLTQEQGTDAPLFPRRKNLTVPDRKQQFKYNPCQFCRRQVHPSAVVSYNGIYLCEDCAAAGSQEVKTVKEHPKPKDKKVTRKPVPTTPCTPFSLDTPAPTLSTMTTLRGTPSPEPSPHQPRVRRKDVPPGYEYLPSPQPIPTTPTNNTHVQYPRYRTPPPPPINTTDITSHQLPIPSPPVSPLRPPQPASSIYPSTPWRLSRPPSMPTVPNAYVLPSKDKVKERDTMYRAEVEEDIIDAYAAESPVSPLSEDGDGGYVNAGWRGRRMF
ncbi:MAG: hypothetical protein Q9166_007550 [cf. Caloplaca sp. 2 TL-2023]